MCSGGGGGGGVARGWVAGRVAGGGDRVGCIPSWMQKASGKEWKSSASVAEGTNCSVAH